MRRWVQDILEDEPPADQDDDGRAITTLFYKLAQTDFDEIGDVNRVASSDEIRSCQRCFRTLFSLIGIQPGVVAAALDVPALRRGAADPSPVVRESVENLVSFIAQETYGKIERAAPGPVQPWEVVEQLAALRDRVNTRSGTSQALCDVMISFLATDKATLGLPVDGRRSPGFLAIN